MGPFARTPSAPRGCGRSADSLPCVHPIARRVSKADRAATVVVDTMNRLPRGIVIGLFNVRLLAVLTGLGMTVPNAVQAAEPKPITRLIPADCVIAYFSKPYTESTTTSRPASQGAEDTDRPKEGSQLASIINFLNLSGLIPDEGQVFADIAGRLPLFGRYEHAAILMDVSSKAVRRPGDPASAPTTSLRLNSLQCAVIFRTGGDNRDVNDHLNHLIGRYTNNEVGKLTREKVHGVKFQRLVDERLIGWAVWEWGAIGDDYAVCFGAGSFEKIAATHAGRAPSLADDAWFKSAGAKVHGDKAHAQWFIAFSRLETRLTEVAGERFSRVVEALQADHLTHDLWAVGRQGRAMSWYRCYRRNGEDVTHIYSDPDDATPALRKIIPPAAKHYAIIHVPTRWLVDNVPRAWVAAQSESHIQTLTAAWKRLEKDTGVDIGKSLIDHFGENIVLFDFPPHPLEIPFALTVAIEIDQRRPVAEAIDTLLDFWSRYLDQRAERQGTKLVRLYVKHDPDGVWYLQAGILGPALKVTDRFVVISWSPQALREALKFIDPPAGRGP